MKPTPWEYYLCAGPSVEELNRLGKEGWEAVSMSDGAHPSARRVLMKRPIPEKEEK